MTRYILLKNARIINAVEKSLCDSDIFIRQGDGQSGSEIVAIGNNISLPDTSDAMIKTLDLHGQFVCPSFTDMRCDICEPGNRNREDFESLGEAAAFGGFGSVCAIPISGIDADDQTILDYISQNGRRTGGIRILPLVHLASESGALNSVESLLSGGAVAVYDDGRASLPTLKKAMQVCAKNGVPVIVHCEEKSLTGDGVMNDGEISKMLGLEGIPASAEEIALAKNLLLAAETSCRLHVSHVSTARSVEMIKKAKDGGVNVTCDTAVQYFALTEGDIPFYSANAKVSPPLRTEKDRQAVIEAIKDGTIDCICSDHSPKSEREKPNDLNKALFGMIGLQSAFTVALDRLVMGGHIDLFRLIELFTSAPASILGIKSEIKVGQRAYLNVFSLDKDTFFQRENSKSKSKNSPFFETYFRGCLTYTVCDGVLRSNPDISVF